MISVTIITNSKEGIVVVVVVNPAPHSLTPSLIVMGSTTHSREGAVVAVAVAVVDVVVNPNPNLSLAREGIVVAVVVATPDSHRAARLAAEKAQTAEKAKKAYSW
jgi:hypothetical protein